MKTISNVPGPWPAGCVTPCWNTCWPPARRSSIDQRLLREGAPFPQSPIPPARIIQRAPPCQMPMVKRSIQGNTHPFTGHLAFLEYVRVLGKEGHSSSTRKTFSNAITSESLYHSFPAFKRIISRFAAGVFNNQSGNHPDEHIRCFLTTFLCSLLTAVVRTGIIKTYT